MTYNIIFDVPAPIEMYDATHASVMEVVGEDDVGLVAHIARATDAGFEIVEIWRSKEAFDHFNTEIWPKVAAKIPGAEGMDAPKGREFDVRGLIVAHNDDLKV
ncbi:hypothetical protein ACVBEQ_07035 [Nakamurella sp. GG22]